MFFFLLFFLLFLFLVFRYFWTIYSFAPWVPVFQKDFQRIFDVLDLKPKEIFYDLGCGDGRVVRFAAKHFGVIAIGVELQFPLFLYCKIRQFFSSQEKVLFKNKNLFDEDLSNADVIYVFGVPRTLAHAVKEKFQKELKPGARVVSYMFRIDGMIPEKVSKVHDKDNSIYLYRF